MYENSLTDYLLNKQKEKYRDNPNKYISYSDNKICEEEFKKYCEEISALSFTVLGVIKFFELKCTYSLKTALRNERKFSEGKGSDWLILTHLIESWVFYSLSWETILAGIIVLFTISLIF